MAAAPSTRTSAVPFFVLAFILFVVLRTVGDDVFGAQSSAVACERERGQNASELFLVCGMTAVGLSVSFNDMWRSAGGRWPPDSWWPRCRRVQPVAHLC